MVNVKVSNGNLLPKVVIKPTRGMPNPINDLNNPVIINGVNATLKLTSNLEVHDVKTYVAGEYINGNLDGGTF